MKFFDEKGNNMTEKKERDKDRTRPQIGQDEKTRRMKNINILMMKQKVEISPSHHFRNRQR